MKWREEGPYLAISDKGYKVAKYMDGKWPIYRASIRGEFIGSPQENFKAAQQICENNLAIIGEQPEGK